MSMKCWFDGCCEPVNPGGHAAYGIHMKKGDKEYKTAGYVGHGEGISNNVAEYSGIIRILEILTQKNLLDEQITIHGDSMLVIQQMSGNWKLKKGAYIPYAQKARDLAKNFPNITYKWIPREENSICDSLSKNILKQMNVRFKIQRD